MGVAASFLPHPHPEKAQELEHHTEKAWRTHYNQAVEKFRPQRIGVVEDMHAGANKYIALHREWGPYVVAFADYMLCEWDEVAAQEGDNSLA